MEIPIEKILDKYSVAAPERAVRKELVVVIEEVIGVVLPVERVSYQKGTLRVDASPLVRSQLRIKKAAILERLQDRIESYRVNDLR